MLIKRTFIFICFLMSITFIGCAGLAVEEEVLNTSAPVQSARRLTRSKAVGVLKDIKRSAPKRDGIYHKVEEGQTLWRIAKTYNVDIDRLIKSNNIPDVANIEKNQLIFVPGVEKLRSIVLETDRESESFVWPVKGRVVQHFHQNKNGRPSQGIDIRTSKGEAVKASRRGKVVFADYMAGHGYTIILDHEDRYYSVYANNAKLLVKLGDQVLKYNEIAMLNAHRNKSQLHFQIRKDYKQQNPLHYLP